MMVANVQGEDRVISAHNSHFGLFDTRPGCLSLQGIFTKHLQYYLDAVNDPARTAKYSGFLGAQQSAVFHFGMAADNLVGSVWYAPNAGGSVFTAQTATSGLAATVAAAKVCHHNSVA